MFIDYLTLLLVNMAAGFLLLAAYLLRGLGRADQFRWAPAFAMVGLVAFVFGAHLTATWPLPAQFNSAFGEMSVLFGVLFLGAALSLGAGWSLLPVAVYAFPAGLAAIVVGVKLYTMGATGSPELTGAGFVLSGLAGVFALPMLAWFGSSRPFRMLAVLVLLATAGIWLVTGYPSLWMHMDSFQEWKPLTMQ